MKRPKHFLLNKFNDIPDIKNIGISFSGGRTSAYMLHQVLETHGGLPDNFKVVFTNTGREMPETLDFIQECSDRWNVAVDWVELRVVDDKFTYEKVSHNSASRNGEPFEQIIDKRGFVPDARSRYCTAELKIRTNVRYLKNHYGWQQGMETWCTMVGIRRDESKRCTNWTETGMNWYPLVGENVTKELITDFWNAQPFDLRLANEGGKTPLGNCDGCFLKSEAALAHFYKEYPERYQWWIDMEERVKDTATGMGKQFRTLNYKTAGEEFGKQPKWAWDAEGFFCQADDGDCTG